MTEPLLNFAPVKIEGGRSFYPNTIFKRQGNNYQDRVTPNLKILLRSSSSILSLQRQTSTRGEERRERVEGEEETPPSSSYNPLLSPLAIICHSLRNSIDPRPRSIPFLRAAKLFSPISREQGYFVTYSFVRIRVA